MDCIELTNFINTRLNELKMELGMIPSGGGLESLAESIRAFKGNVNTFLGDIDQLNGMNPPETVSINKG